MSVDRVVVSVVLLIGYAIYIAWVFGAVPVG